MAKTKKREVKNTMAAITKLTWQVLFQKLIGGVFLAMFGIVIGWFVGGIFESMGILTTLPWQEFTTFIGATCGFLLGTQITE